jgi:23S rRNA U2552 (ribose-2'-O)-methylase RlmE/FtsJ
MYKVIDCHGIGGPPMYPLQLFNSKIHTKSTSYVCTLENKALQQAKSSIDMFYEEGKWDDYKKITNPYEYIFLSWNRRSSRSVATRQPLSRSYFKLLEMWKYIGMDKLLQELYIRDEGFITAHAAEGPGGFIEACDVCSQKEGWTYKNAFAITLRSEAKNVPGWKKAAQFLQNHPQIIIHDGADHSGNILLEINQDVFVTDLLTLYPKGVHLYTADGGFDFSHDYNAQEDIIFPLLLAEVIIGLRVLCKGGVFIIKCFDTMEQPTLDLLWLIRCSFAEWSIIKPCTSRAGNAERYIIGKGFLGDVGDILDILHKYQENGDFKQPILHFASLTDDWRSFLANIVCLQEQIEHLETSVIQETLKLIKHTDHIVIRDLVKENVQRSIEWCMKHGEDVAGFWIYELDKNIIREVNDLLNILHVSSVSTYSIWTKRMNLHNSTLTFEGFRSGIEKPPSLYNPFIRLKSIPKG